MHVDRRQKTALERELEPEELADAVAAEERRAEGFNAMYGAALASDYRQVAKPKIGFQERRFAWEQKLQGGDNAKA